MARRLWIAAAILAGFVSTFMGQTRRVEDLAQGKLLVASRNLPDPNFAETVVLLARYDEKGALGLILNRRTEVPISKVLEKSKAAQRRLDPVYLGGPVARTGLMALLRAPEKPADGALVLDDVYMASSPALVEKTLAEKERQIRLYLGYAGWGAGQLDREVEIGAWHVFSGDARLVFDSDPESLWERLIKRTQLRIAYLGVGRW